MEERDGETEGVREGDGETGRQGERDRGRECYRGGRGGVKGEVNCTALVCVFPRARSHKYALFKTSRRSMSHQTDVLLADQKEERQQKERERERV